jgi:hypothetical protein
MSVPMTGNKKRFIFVSCLLAIGLCGYAYFSVFGPDEFVWRDRIREGEELATRVETFRQEHHRLPESLEETGLRNPDSLRLYYSKCNDSQYFIWFGSSLGESMTYNSVTRKWEPYNHPCPK